MEDVAATTPSDAVASVIGKARVGLRLDGRLVQLVAADGARVCRRSGRRGERTSAGQRAAARCTPVQMSHDQKVTAFLRGGAARKRWRGRWAGARGSARTGGHSAEWQSWRRGAPARHFLTTKRGPAALSSALLSTSMSACGIHVAAVRGGRAGGAAAQERAGSAAPCLSRAAHQDGFCSWPVGVHTQMGSQIG